MPRPPKRSVGPDKDQSNSLVFRRSVAGDVVAAAALAVVAVAVAVAAARLFHRRLDCHVLGAVGQGFQIALDIFAGYDSLADITLEDPDVVDAVALFSRHRHL